MILHIGDMALINLARHVAFRTPLGPDVLRDLAKLTALIRAPIDQRVRIARVGEAFVELGIGGDAVFIEGDRGLLKDLLQIVRQTRSIDRD